MTQIIEISQKSRNNKGNNRKEKFFSGLLVVVFYKCFFSGGKFRMTSHPG